ncbi:MAG: TldD/PmbA family protein [Drouetiella hepatica Uher 2000/2452]|jgi:PmbA protein|uniref:TldD/PmbA family protein n=1 Tax=Drouetiella hepatica Uher 2000/2452 TaxID=904376 RepID=A0A951QBK5_9CYAN|nr:TldD/PmbA family protein [Drouetiella hepatica Uher 2000/2452]
MSDTLLETILALAAPRTDAAEVYYVSSQDTPIDFENNRLKSLQTKALQGVALRVICNGRLGFASSTDLTRLEDLVDAAVQTAEIGSPAEFEFAADFHSSDNGNGSDYTPPTTPELVAIGEELIQQVHGYNADVLVEAGFRVRSGIEKIATNQNVYAERSSRTVSASLSGNLVRGEDFLQPYSYDVGRDRTPDFDRILQDLLQKYRWAEQNAAISSGSYPVLFTPQAVARTFRSLFSTALSGQAVLQKTSLLADKLGETLFDDRFSLFEDPSQGISACTFDDEGTPTSRKTYIDRGKITGFYWDRRWAARAGQASTGNGFRGGLSRPAPSTVNLCISPGSTSTADLIANMEEGVIVDQVLGAGQSNQLAGEFSVNLDLGYKVEKGKIVGRLKNTMVAGSIFEAFQQLVDLGDQPEWVGGSSYVPSLLFGKLGVASRN